MDNLLDLRVICCTCLNVTHSTTSIQHKDLKYNVSFAEMINKICSIEFELNDDFPNKLCYTCADKLRIAYEFRLMCDDSRNILLDQRKHSQHPTPLQLSEPEAEVLDHAENDAPVDTSNDLIEYDGAEEYLEEYLQDTADIVPTKECTNSGENTFTSLAEERVKYEAIIEEQNVSDEENAIATESQIIPNNNNDEDAIQENENQCTICGLVLSKLAHLTRHMKSHTASKSFRCTQCPKSFSRSDNLRVHEANHSSMRRFKCPQCERRFKRSFALKVHLGTQHKQFVEANFLVCNVCRKFFKTKDQLNRHMKRHEDPCRFVCDVCGQTFFDRIPYDAHLEKHANKELLVCLHCTKHFADKTQLMYHIRYHTAEKSFKCNYCESSFARKADLKIHENYHTSTKNHRCQTCGKSFHRLCALKTHMLTHTDEKPYQCSHCPKRFRQKYDMITHERRHTGERFQCEMCVQKFIHAYELNSHLKIVHNSDVQCRRRGVKKIFNEPC